MALLNIINISFTVFMSVLNFTWLTSLLFYKRKPFRKFSDFALRKNEKRKRHK